MCCAVKWKFQTYGVNTNIMAIPIYRVLLYIVIYTTTTTVTLLSQSTGWTALMFAVNEGHEDIAQRLVSAGADVHIKDKVCGIMECVMENHVYSILAIRNEVDMENKHRGKYML